VKIYVAFLLCSAAPFAAASQSAPVLMGQQKPVQAAPAHTADQAAVTKSTAGIDPAKEAAIRRLFEIQGINKSFQQIVTTMISNMRPMMNSSLPPGEYREKLLDLFSERFQSKLRVEQFVNLTIPIYDKYFTQDEIEGLTKFYQTALGKKVITVLPQVLVESQTESMKLGEKYGREAMAEVLEEHPDLKKGLEEAATAPK
jgi:hypothetical protein